jgi:murein DD-endopeptidase MepM/ murein hydrolase activator NlpD
MTRAAAVAAALALIGATGASGASDPVFTAVSGTPALPSAEVPNAPGSVAMPPELSTPPLVPRTMSFADLNALWHRAATAYGIPWQVLAAINKVESNFGRNMGPSSAGAVGWMQFMPSTWVRWGTDASGDGVADPWDPEDAVFSAARYLAAAGAHEDLARGVFAYNHADWYVQQVLSLASVYSGGNEVLTFNLDRMQVRLDDAREHVAKAKRALGRALAVAGAARRAEHAVTRKLSRIALLSDRLVFEQRAYRAGVRADEAVVQVQQKRDALADARAALEAARSGISPGANPALLGTPSVTGGYAFPVGGGAGQVSVSHHHHDYPAADIAAPDGAPLYALTEGFVQDAWPTGAGACGIGFKMLAGDGRTWTYCHMSSLEPAVVAGVPLSVGAPVGVVGATGHATGPHLHLQTGPELTYPQQEPWFQSFAGTAFTWQDNDPAAGPHEELWPASTFPASPVFAVVDQPVFEVVEADPPAADDVVEFTLSS